MKRDSDHERTLLVLNLDRVKLQKLKLWVIISQTRFTCLHKNFNCFHKRLAWGLYQWSSGRNCALKARGAVQSLVLELRS